MKHFSKSHMVVNLACIAILSVTVANFFSHHYFYLGTFGIVLIQLISTSYISYFVYRHTKITEYTAEKIEHSQRFIQEAWKRFFKDPFFSSSDETPPEGNPQKPLVVTIKKEPLN